MILSFSTSILLGCPTAAFVIGVWIGRISERSRAEKMLRAFWVGGTDVYAAYSEVEALRQALYDDPGLPYTVEDVAEISHAEMWDEVAVDEPLGSMLKKARTPGWLAGIFK